MNAKHRSMLSLAGLAAVMFFIVCGGTYGLEQAVSEAGAWWTLVLVIAIPFVWSIPISLMVAELAALMPEEGGYYAWVRRELGAFWGTQAGWWAVCMSAVDMALYPALFVRYLGHLVPGLGVDAPLARWSVAAGVVALALVLNLRGARSVGRNAVAGLAVVLGPLLVFSVVALAQQGLGGALAAVARDAPRDLTFASLATGLSIVMWNYMGWDSASTLAGEVRDPQRNYPRALALVGAATVLVYLLPLVAGLALFPDRARWSDWTVWPTLGREAAGAWLGVAIALAGLAAQWALFNSNLLYASRLPYAMAANGALLAWFARESTKAVPAVSLLVLGIIVVVLVALPFEKLVVVDVLLYSAVLALEFAVLVRLRWREPQRPRPFRIAGGWTGIAIVTALPAACGALLLWTTLADDAEYAQLAAVGAVLASGIAVHALAVR